MYITKDENTEEFFSRFKIIELKGKPWEVQAVDSLSSEGVIEVALKETYSNTIEKEIPKVEVTNVDNSEEHYIKGASEVSPYDIVFYTVENSDIIDGQWSINNNKAKIKNIEGNKATIEIITGRSGEFILTFKAHNLYLTKEIKIKSL
jgi:hypothetical protein